LDIKEVLAIWRESVPEELRKKWLNIDPTEEDRLLPPADAVVAAESPPAVAEAPAATEESAREAVAAATSSEAVATGAPAPPARAEPTIAP